ncbi:hypothetical protein ACIGD1_17250 [Streptomyces sp. NPDC085612]|uniref:hypothetical protein n=1 Tax=Streptomyces sp. NPDC085612 TaxID=3365732 RepID=UPI0037D37BE7
MRRHELVVIGAGSGNAVVDDSFADLDVAIVEDRWFGGTCLTAGCVPSKMFARTAHVARAVEDAGTYDVDAGPGGTPGRGGIRWRDAREAKVVAHNLRHPDDPIARDHDFVPAAVFTRPQIASVGATEQDCLAHGLDYAVGTAEYADIAYGWAMEDDAPTLTGSPYRIHSALTEVVENALLDLGPDP